MLDEVSSCNLSQQIPAAILHVNHCFCLAISLGIQNLHICAILSLMLVFFPSGMDSASSTLFYFNSKWQYDKASICLCENEIAAQEAVR